MGKEGRSAGRRRRGDREGLMGHGIAPALAGIGPLLVYLLTMAPDLGSIDSGELATVCTNLQVAHPTGYPLYALLGRLATLVLPGSTPIARLNLLSVLLASLSGLFAFFLFRSLVERIRPSAPALHRDLLALGSAWIWSVHPALWSQAVGNEVHSLQAAIVSAVLVAAVWDKSRKTRLLVVYLSALGLANHMTFFYLLPGLILWGLLLGIRCRPTGASLFWGGVLLWVPLLLYLYLPLRSATEPLLDWGNPTSPERLFRHVAASQYRVWFFASTESFAANLGNWLGEFRSLPNLPLWIFGLIGAARLARRDPETFCLLIGGFLVGSIWASGYEIHDLEPYYLVPRLCLASIAVAGASSLMPSNMAPKWRVVPLVVPIVTAVLLTGLRWSEQSRRGDRFVRLYAESLLQSLPQNSILLTRHWDMVVSPALYLQQVEGIRPDLTVVDVELLRRSWYFPQLRRTDPELLAPIEDRVHLFLELLERFEANEPYDAGQIEQRYRSVISGLFEAHRLDRPIFHTPEVDPFYRGWVGVPETQTIRIIDEAATAPAVEPPDLAVWREQARYVDEPVRRTAWGFLAELGRSRIAFLDNVGRTEEAARWRSWLGQFRRISLGEGEGSPGGL